MLKIAQEVTGRHGDYDGRISLLARYRKKTKLEDQPEKEKVVTHLIKITLKAPTEISEVKPITAKPEP